MLPAERAVRGYLRRKFPRELRHMEALHNLAVRSLSRRLRPQYGIDTHTLWVAAGLFAKACKQHRAIQLLCRAGLGTDAHALTRNLFETTLALFFVLRKRVTLKQGGRRTARVDWRPLNSRLRSRLYNSNIQFEKQRAAKDWLRTPGLKRAGRTKLRQAQIDAGAAQVERVIGAKWTMRLKGSKTYSGLNLRDLAESLRLGVTYVLLYKSASWSTHAVDLDYFVRETPTGIALELEPGERLVKESISGSSLLLLMGLDIINERLGMGLDHRLSVHGPRFGLRVK